MGLEWVDDGKDTVKLIHRKYGITTCSHKFVLLKHSALTPLDPITVLKFLSEFLSEISRKLSDASHEQLSEIEIVCESRALKDTYFGTKGMEL